MSLKTINQTINKQLNTGETVALYLQYGVVILSTLSYTANITRIIANIKPGQKWADLFVG
jgi:hypothetical protein